MSQPPYGVPPQQPPAYPQQPGYPPQQQGYPPQQQGYPPQPPPGYGAAPAGYLPPPPPSDKRTIGFVMGLVTAVVLVLFVVVVWLISKG